MSRFYRQFRYGWAILPLLLFAIDMARFPHLLHSEQASPVTLAELEKSGARSLGRLKYHEVFASLDDLEDADYLSELGGRTAGTIVSAFYPKDAKQLLGGPLYRSVKKRLDGAAHAAADDYDRALEKGRQEAWVKDCVRFTVPSALRPRTRLDHVYTVLLAEDGDQDTTPEVVEVALDRCYKLAAEDRSRVLVLHAVAVNPRNDRALRIGTLFEKALEKLPDCDRSTPDCNPAAALYLSIYKKWDGPEKARALEEVQNEQERAIRGFEGWSPRLADGELRVFLLLLALCLLCAAPYVELRPLGFLAVCGAYFAFWKGAEEIIEKLGSEYSKDEAFLARLAVSVIAAIFFRQLARKVELDALFVGSSDR